MRTRHLPCLLRLTPVGLPRLRICSNSKQPEDSMA